MSEPKNEALDPNVVLEACKDRYDTVVVIGSSQDVGINVHATLDLDLGNTMAMLTLAQDHLVELAKERMGEVIADDH